MRDTKAEATAELLSLFEGKSTPEIVAIIVDMGHTPETPYLKHLQKKKEERQQRTDTHKDVTFDVYAYGDREVLELKSGGITKAVIPYETYTDFIFKSIVQKEGYLGTVAFSESQLEELKTIANESNETK